MESCVPAGEEAHHKYSPQISYVCVVVCAVRFFCASGNKMQPRENSTTDADDDDDVDDDSCCIVVLVWSGWQMKFQILFGDSTNFKLYPCRPRRLLLKA